MLTRIGVVLLAALVSVALIAAPGQARTKTVRDDTKTGSTDIRRVTVSNDKRTVTTRTLVVLMTDRRVCSAVRYGKKGSRVQYVARTCAGGGGLNKRHRLVKIKPSGTQKRVKCPRMRSAWGASPTGVVPKMTVPRRCSPKMGRRVTHFKVYSYSGGNVDDRTPRFRVRRG